MRFPEFHYRWEWQLQATPDALWPVLADTNRFNRDTGVPNVERGAAGLEASANTRTRLRFRRFGVPLEWEEMIRNISGVSWATECPFSDIEPSSGHHSAGQDLRPT